MTHLTLTRLFLQAGEKTTYEPAFLTQVNAPEWGIQSGLASPGIPVAPGSNSSVPLLCSKPKALYSLSGLSVPGASWLNQFRGGRSQSQSCDS